MEKHIENFLNKISTIFLTISAIILLHLYLKTPSTCISPSTQITKPHHRFPSSTCDPSLLNQRPYLPLSKKNQRIWSSKAWISQVSAYTNFFNNLCNLSVLRNDSKVLCVSAGAGHEIMALNQMGISDVTGIDIVDSLPLVKKADPNNLPFFDGVFDLGFSFKLLEALFPFRFVEEIERTVRIGGFCVFVVDQCGDSDLSEIVGLFKKSQLVNAENFTLIGVRMTRIVMKVVGNSRVSSKE